MKDLFFNKQYNMKFTNEEIIRYLIEPAERDRSIEICISTDETTDVARDTHNRITYVSFDGNKEELYVSFMDDTISIFVLNEEIMFLDDKVKESVSSSDTYHNVVYEGTLRDKTHEEILKLIHDVIMIVKGAKEIQIEETVIEQVGIHYPKCKYIVRISKDNKEKRDVQLDNIQFIIN